MYQIDAITMCLDVDESVVPFRLSKSFIPALDDLCG